MSQDNEAKDARLLWEAPRLEQVDLRQTAAQKLAGASENDFQSPDNPLPPS